MRVGSLGQRVLLWDLLLLACSVCEARGLLMRGDCQKAHRSIHFTVPGYFTSPIHTNQCRETVSSDISPVVSLNPTELLLFRRHYSTCCCAIGNTSLHEVGVGGGRGGWGGGERGGG